MSVKRTILVTSALPYANNSSALGARRRVRPNRRLGALSAPARPPLLYVCASDAHGTPTMLRAEQEGIAPETLDRARQRRAPPRFRDLSHQRRQLLDDALARERGAHGRALSAPRGAAASSPARRSSKPTTRSGRCSCRIATSAARARSAARRISTATRAKAAARRTRRSSSRMPFRRCPARRRPCASPSTCS